MMLVMACEVGKEPQPSHCSDAEMEVWLSTLMSDRVEEKMIKDTHVHQLSADSVLIRSILYFFSLTTPLNYLRFLLSLEAHRGFDHLRKLAFRIFIFLLGNIIEMEFSWFQYSLCRVSSRCSRFTDACLIEKGGGSSI